MTYNLNLTDKVAFVTGGARGIGAAIVKTLVNQGARVAFTYINNTDAAMKLESTLKNCMAIKADCKNSDDTQAAVTAVLNKWQKIDVLVLNAGITKDRVSWKLDEEAFDDVLHTNLKGAFLTAKQIIPHFRENQSGKIITISSINGLRGKAGQVAYASSKGGLIAFTKSLAKELGPKNIKVNAIAPGLIKTEMTKHLPEAILTTALEETAIKKLGTPNDVANVVLFFASDLANHITGQVLNVDGGQLI